MENSSLLNIYSSHPKIREASAYFDAQQNGKTSLNLSGLTGSAGSVVVSSLFAQAKKTFVCILNDEEEAGYFYHDCCQMLTAPPAPHEAPPAPHRGEVEKANPQVLFFPSGFRRAIRYGQKDPASEILRTDVLNRLNSSLNTNHSTLITTYPEALAEKVVSPDSLEMNTLSVSVGEKIDTSFVEEV
ncbi:MAG: hypothetical protein LBR64_01705, partial [Dysgonamonadaceae bacterium]|nr:hypothetical protein [Dysgonamonadaceae bacterium]